MRKKRAIYIRVPAAMIISVCFMQVQQARAEVCSESEDAVVITSETVYDMEQIADPEVEWRAENGMIYRLKSWEIEEMQEEARQEYVRETVFCCDIAGPEEVELSRQISSTDERTGRTVITEGRRVQMFPVEERWMDGVKIPLICYLCRDERGRSGGDPVIYNELEPPKEACMEILRRLGISEDNYEISSITWEGELFKSSDGYLCRMVQAQGRQRLKDYQVVYEGTAVFPEIPSYRCRAVYELENEPAVEEALKPEESAIQNEDGKRVTEEPEIKGDTEEKKSGETKRKDKAVRLIKETVSITMTMGVPLLLAAVLLWSISVSRHKKK